jgi:hypothetical protein
MRLIEQSSRSGKRECDELPLSVKVKLMVAFVAAAGGLLYHYFSARGSF